jgi:hypothetical protein
VAEPVSKTIFDENTDNIAKTAGISCELWRDRQFHGCTFSLFRQRLSIIVKRLTLFNLAILFEKPKIKGGEQNAHRPNRFG